MPRSEDAPGSMGAWTPIELAETARSNMGVGADEDMRPDLRFRSSVAKLLRRRRALPIATMDSNRPAVFLLQPAPPDLAPGYVSQRVPMLDNGMTAVNGRVWFVSEVTVCGRYIDLRLPNDHELFELVTDTFGLAVTPAIVFDRRLPVPEARFYPRGLGSPETVEPVSLGDGEITLIKHPRSHRSRLSRLFRHTLSLDQCGQALERP